MIKITIDENTGLAELTIGKKTNQFPVALRVDNIWTFTNPVWVGVRIGNGGTKVWKSSVDIVKTRNGEWGIMAYSPLNTVNRNIPRIEIVDFWENIPDTSKSKR